MTIGLTASLDVGSATSGILDKSLRLINATIEDNVHPGAVIAAGALGASLFASEHRLLEAGTCLGANESVKVDSIKAVLGLKAGGLRREIGHDTALLRTFLLCTSLKRCYTDQELGNLLYHMLLSKGLLVQYRVTSTQLCQFVKQISGHAEAIAPTRTMHKVFTHLQPYATIANKYRRIATNVLADLLNQVFEAFRDQEVKVVTLTGHDQGIWISTALLWIFADEACVYVGEDPTPLQGNQVGRLHIHLKENCNEPWRVEEWREANDMREYIFPYDTNEPDDIRRIPACALVSYLDERYWAPLRTGSLRSKARALTGRIAEGLISYTLQESSLLLMRRCGEKRAHRCSCVTPVCDIAGLDWLQRPGLYVSLYGWGPEADGQHIRESMISWLEWANEDERRQERKRGSENPLVSFKSAFELEIMQELGRDIMNNMNSDECKEIWENLIPTAIYVAVHAISTSIVTVLDGETYIQPPSSKDLQDAERFLESLLEGGLEILELKRLAMKYSLPGAQDIEKMDLACSANGYVASMSILNGHCTDPRQALAVEIRRGGIQKDEYSYSCIREVSFASVFSEAPSGISVDEVKDLPLGSRFLLREPTYQSTYRFETLVSPDEDKLKLMHYMIKTDIRSKNKSRRIASWNNAAAIFACAIHLSGDDISPSKEQILLASFKTDRRLSTISCLSSFSNAKIAKGRKLLIMTGEREKERLFSTADFNDMDDECCTIFIRHKGFLSGAIHYVMDTRTFLLIS